MSAAPCYFSPPETTELEMISAEQDLARHQDIYKGFTKFLMWLSVTTVVVIVILAFVTL